MATKDWYFFVGWFESKSLDEAVMVVVSEMFGMAKINIKVLC